MREEEKKKGKIDRSLSLGVAVLVFLMLAAQFAVFVKYLFENLRSGELSVAEAADTLPVTVADVTAPDSFAMPETVYETPSVSRGSAESSVSGSAAASVDSVSDIAASGSGHDGWKWDMVELNSADSAALDALPWIGPYYAKQIIRYREKLWGSYADITQLLDIRGIDAEMLDKFSDRIYIDSSSVNRLDLYSLPEDSLAMHPYIGPYAAKGICRYREMVKREEFTVSALVENGILSAGLARRISLYTYK